MGPGDSSVLVSLNREGTFALAHVTLPSGQKLWRSQWALLESNADGWVVRAVALQRAHDLACRAPADVMRRLAGGCAKLPTDPSGAIVGPTASRPASRAELAMIARVARHFLRGHDSCITYAARIATLDPHYARVAYEFHKPYGNCQRFDGVDIYERTQDGWRRIGGASDPFTCNFAPPGIIRSLFGMCWIYFPR